MRWSILLVLSALLGGCQMIQQRGLPAGDPEVGGLKARSAEWRGLKFARDRCSACHSVEYGQISPIPRARPFIAVSNTPGLSRTTLNRWLRTHESHPEEMYFEIPAEHIDDLVAYMLTLREVGEANTTRLAP